MSVATLEEVAQRAAGIEAGGVALPIVRRDAPGDGFERMRDLHADPAHVQRLVRQNAELGGVGDLEHVGAQWWFERCAWTVAAVGLACALTSGRVPSLDPDDLLLACADGLPTAVGLRDAPLPAGPPEAVLGPQLARHLAPLADALTARRLRPPRALWRAAGDRLVLAALWVGEALDRQEEAVALAAAAVAAGSPLEVPVRVVQGAEGRPDHLRRSCCLAHRTPSAVVCPNCPRAHGLDAAGRVVA